MSRAARPSALGLTGLLLLTGCAFTPGTGFATVQGAQVTAEVPMGTGRLDPQGRWLTANGYRVTLAERGLALTLQTVALQAPGAAAASGPAAPFDPANPPPGYSLCHGGHCHRDDGALIDYAEIQASQGPAGPAAPVRVLALTPTEKTVAIAPNRPGTWNLTGCDPDCFLERGSVTGAALALDTLSGEGTIEAGAGITALPEGVRRFSFSLPLANQPLTQKLTATIDRAQPAAYRLSGSFRLTDKLFDGIEWERLAAHTAQAGTLDLTADTQTRETLLTNLAKSEWKSDFVPQP